MTDELLYEVRDRVRVITFNRPERMNTITIPMLNALSERLLQADADPDVRVIVLTGAGRAWCAGLDIGAAVSGEGIGGEGSNSSGNGEFNLRDAPPVVLHKIDTPTIASMNGAAAGYGLDLALGCDLGCGRGNGLSPASAGKCGPPGREFGRRRSCPRRSFFARPN